MVDNCWEEFFSSFRGGGNRLCSLKPKLTQPPWRRGCTQLGIPEVAVVTPVPCSWGSEAGGFRNRAETVNGLTWGWQLLVFALADFPLCKWFLAIETANLLSAPLCKLHLHLNCIFFRRMGLVNNWQIKLEERKLCPYQIWDWSDIWLLLLPFFWFNNSMWH